MSSDHDFAGRAIVVGGLSFGDEGKGATIDFLARGCRQHPFVIRYNGGPQAAHRVLTPDGVEHVFAQFASGTLSGCTTILSRFMLVDPLALMTEAEALREKTGLDPYDRLLIDRKCLMVTPFHKAANRLREMSRGDARHGSCGMGVGETVEFALKNQDRAPRIGDGLDALSVKLPGVQSTKYRDVEPWLSLDWSEGEVLGHADAIHEFLRRLREFYEVARFYDSDDLGALTDGCPLIFEGAHGALLDGERGIGAPDHATWSDNSFAWANRLLDDIGIDHRDIYRIGVARTFLTRHGPGPLPGEDASILATVAHEHNEVGRWQGPLRTAPWSNDLHEIGLGILGDVDGVALTHCDWPGSSDALDALGASVCLRSYGPTAAEREWL